MRYFQHDRAEVYEQSSPDRICGWRSGCRCRFDREAHSAMNMAKRPRDPNQLAKLIVDIATGEAADTVSDAKRKVSKRRAGGLKGGASRSKRHPRSRNVR
jgi:hypothetical protein